MLKLQVNNMNLSELKILLLVNIIAVIVLIIALSLRENNKVFYIFTIAVVIGEIATLVLLQINKK